MRRATWMVCLGALSACGSGSATGTTTPQPSDAAQTARSFTEQIGATTTPGPGTDITAIDLGQVVSITLTPTTKSVSFAAQVQLQPGQQHFSWRLKPTSVGTAQSNAKIALEVADDETSIVEFLHEQGLATTDDDAASWLADNCRLPRLDGKLRRDLGWNCEPTSFLTGSPRSVDYQPGFHPRVVTVIVSAFYPPNA
ncbi:MAG TPA: hypothetical protein VLD86_17890, partial [Ilumatobacteraceae bacterium]|nr:hypothetical protein [Ilumatobacteraceae bacterium]